MNTVATSAGVRDVAGLVKRLRECRGKTRYRMCRLAGLDPKSKTDLAVVDFLCQEHGITDPVTPSPIYTERAKRAARETLRREIAAAISEQATAAPYKKDGDWA